MLSIDINYTSHRARVRWDNQRIRLSGILRRSPPLAIALTRSMPAGRNNWRNANAKAACCASIWPAFSMMQVMMYAVPAYRPSMTPSTPTLTPDALGQSAANATGRVLLVVTVLSRLHGVTCNDAGHGRAGNPLAFSALFASIWAALTQSDKVYFDSVSMFVFLLLAVGRFRKPGPQQGRVSSRTAGHD